MTITLWIILGIFFGAPVGFMTAALMNMARENNNLPLKINWDLANELEANRDALEMRAKWAERRISYEQGIIHRRT